MKKEYIKPNMEIVNADSEVSMMSSSFSEVTQEPQRPDATEHRGSWGNLWD